MSKIEGASEQENLASLIPEDREVLNTSEMIWGSLKDNLGKIGNIKPEIMDQVQEEIANNPDISAESKRAVASAKSSKKSVLSSNVSTEKLLVSLFEIHDGMISTFEVSGIDSPVSKNLSDLISYMEDCIRYIGGKVESFDPMSHVSGLDVPDTYKNAQKVIDTTTQCYKMGKIIDSSVDDNGSTIKIVFAGMSKGVSYCAHGFVNTSSWGGNEAIDFVYTPGQGKMSVKVFEKGKWVDKSETGNYNIKWELEESDMQDSEGSKEKKDSEEKNAQSANTMKEVVKSSENNVTEIKENPEDEEIGDFPIIDRQEETHEEDHNKSRRAEN